MVCVCAWESVNAFVCKIPHKIILYSIILWIFTRKHTAKTPTLKKNPVFIPFFLIEFSVVRSFIHSLVWKLMYVHIIIWIFCYLIFGGSHFKIEFKCQPLMPDNIITMLPYINTYMRPILLCSHCSSIFCERNFIGIIIVWSLLSSVCHILPKLIIWQTLIFSLILTLLTICQPTNNMAPTCICMYAMDGSLPPPYHTKNVNTVYLEYKPKMSKREKKLPKVQNHMLFAIYTEKPKAIYAQYITRIIHEI